MFENWKTDFCPAGANLCKVSRSSLKKNNDELAKALNKCKLLIGRPASSFP
jgi:hypothetical protein